MTHETPMGRRADEVDGVQLGARVDARTPGIAGAVIAVRVPRDLLARIVDHASARGLSVTEVVREGVERLVAGPLKDLDE